jgi:hypothetical protein
LLLETRERLDIGSEMEVLASLPEHPNMMLKGIVIRAAGKSMTDLFRFGVRLEPGKGHGGTWERLLGLRFFSRDR